MKVKLETFTAEPSCAGCTHLLELAEEIENKYEGKVEVINHIGPCEETQGIIEQKKTNRKKG